MLDKRKLISAALMLGTALGGASVAASARGCECVAEL